jgi:hypothetical protein
VVLSCGKDPGLTVPAGWKKTGLGIYELGDPEKQYRETVRVLNDGLQPWRTEAACAAAACLLDFGVSAGENAVSLSVGLKTIEENALYSFTKDGVKYFITVKFFEDVPVPVQLKAVFIAE